MCIVINPESCKCGQALLRYFHSISIDEVKPILIRKLVAVHTLLLLHCAHDLGRRFQSNIDIRYLDVCNNSLGYFEAYSMSKQMAQLLHALY